MGILDYTTKVPVSRTIAQIQAKLVEHGARAVMMEYGDDGRIKALAFNVKMPNGELPIRLPINTASTLRVLQRQAADREIPAGYAKDDHAYRVAWRNIFHWVSGHYELQPEQWPAEHLQGKDLRPLNEGEVFKLRGQLGAR